MIIGHGIDIVKVERFISWGHYSPAQLVKIFSLHEIAYCRACPTRSAARFAARFAVREAFLKACSQAYPDKSFSLLRVSNAIAVHHTDRKVAYLHVDWAKLGIETNHRVLISLSHEKECAIASVIIVQIP